MTPPRSVRVNDTCFAFGSNPIKTNQVASRDKIRKINSKVEIFGETISFNVYPIEEIVPSEEITLSIDNTIDNDKVQSNTENMNNFTHLDREGDDFIEINPKQGMERYEGGGEIVDKNSQIIPDILQSSNLEQLNPETPTSPSPRVEDSFLSKTISTESSFFYQQPQKSSPEKLININKQSIVPRYILDEERKTRSQGGDNKIHVQIALRNPIKRKK